MSITIAIMLLPKLLTIENRVVPINEANNNKNPEKPEASHVMLACSFSPSLIERG
jgi:hypothetical protein